MIKYKLLILLAAIMVACNRSDTPDLLMPDGYIPSTNPIPFQSEDNWGDEVYTKAADIKVNFAQEDNIGVIGYFLASNGAAAPTGLSSDAIPNFMYNQKMIYNGSYWSYSPVRYWPNNNNDRLQFFAYYPQSDGITLSNSDAKGYPTILFEPAANPYKQADFMTATSAMVGKESGEVRFNFEHQLSQVTFQARHNDESGRCKVVMVGITLTGPKIYKGQFTADGFEWDTTDGVETHNYVATDDYKEIVAVELDSENYTMVTDEVKNGIMLITPQKLLENDIKIYATFKAKLPDQPLPIEVTQVIVVPKAHEYLKGKRVNYQFTLNVKDLAVAKFDNITITDWVDGGEIHTEGDVIL